MNLIDFIYHGAVAGAIVPLEGNDDYVINPVHDWLQEDDIA